MSSIPQPPADVLEWSSEDVAAWIDSLGMQPPYGQLFLQNEADGPTLLGLSEEDLSFLGIHNNIHRKKILAYLGLLRQHQQQQYEEPSGVSATVPQMPSGNDGHTWESHTYNEPQPLVIQMRAGHPVTPPGPGPPQSPQDTLVTPAAPVDQGEAPEARAVVIGGRSARLNGRVAGPPPSSVYGTLSAACRAYVPSPELDKLLVLRPDRSQTCNAALTSPQTAAGATAVRDRRKVAGRALKDVMGQAYHMDERARVEMSQAPPRRADRPCVSRVSVSRRRDDETRHFAHSCWREEDNTMAHTRCSRYLTRGVTPGAVDSTFGLDSPSFSLRGSWSRARRRFYNDEVPGRPGPATYHVNYRPVTALPGGPAAFIGSSGRDGPGERRDCSPGPIYLPARSRKVLGGVMPRGKRVITEHAQVYDRSPGPQSYFARWCYLSNLR
ncbi:unnamed protein product [Vitrella brassicaformis CCMP3155]|uniref:SAM domain-containing protein n=1 Tax=Vitrella brassicaformis (strain CCMP3155) TaxID=1169540 RepID=A0A0G4ED49_VITBC|nr:unnamed protein product [Vitrella brassicaformis CCMP3155]|eukprot:CEL93263.1 unnamed protein product [Vitrella brassicaformis CCMP3155]